MSRISGRLVLVALFLLVTGWYLYPTLSYWAQSRNLDSLPPADREEKVLSLAGLKERTLNLGLDLQGGIHVTMEVRVEALIDALAAQPVDPSVTEALASAREEALTSDTPFSQLFVDAYEEQNPDGRLSRFFRDDGDGITRRSSNNEIQAWLQREADAAVDRAIEIVRQRVDRFGVTEPSIVKQGTRRIVVELPGVDDPERVRRLLRGTARLEFRLMGEPEEVQQSVQDLIAYYEPGSNAPAVADSLGDDLDAVAQADTALDLTNLATADNEIANPMLRVLNPVGVSPVSLGTIAVRDTAAFNELMRDPGARELLPPDVDLMYSSQSVGQGEDILVVLAVRSQVELTGDVVTDAAVDFDPQTNAPQVSMEMNGEGARTWSRLTGANVGKQVAIAMDNVVFSYPNILGRITGGRTSITGLDSRAEATDIVTILKSGSLPAPVDIIEEGTVGPSLGAASIRAGFTSLLVGLTLVALFMIFYYRGAGSIADIALLLNIIFILGILGAFRATLTLPGIAGIVLTIGMAVDANVLIFDRVREEVKYGRTLRGAIDAGYEKAFSAILDANVTTFFTGLILYSFGVGPIKGFAVTLMAGIIASLFSALVITRIMFDYLVGEKRQEVSIG